MTTGAGGPGRRGDATGTESEDTGGASAVREPSPSARGSSLSPSEPSLSARERALEAVDRRLPYLLVTPALLLLAALVVYPVVRAVELSLHEVALLSLDARTYVGLGNYRALLGDPTFARVVENTVVFVGASVVGQFGIGLGLALLLDRRWLDDRLERLFRTAFLLPWATTGVVVAYSWQVMFDARLGLVNGFLRWVGVANPPAWLGSVEWAMVAVVIANVWRGLPFSVVFQSSGLQSVPARLYEAADVGGASALQQLRHVTLPLLRPFLAMNVVLVTLFTLNVFDIIYVMTGGGPLESTEVLALHMYDTAFDLGRFGRGNAIAVVLFALNLGLALLSLGAIGDRRGVRP